MEELEIAVVRIENEVSTNYGSRQGFLSKKFGGQDCRSLGPIYQFDG